MGGGGGGGDGGGLKEKKGVVGYQVSFCWAPWPRIPHHFPGEMSGMGRGALRPRNVCLGQVRREKGIHVVGVKAWFGHAACVGTGE